MIVGFTGTRRGMTREQRLGITRLLEDFSPSEVHHGDCIGADSDFHSIALFLGIPIIGHPASGIGSQRAYNKGFTQLCEPLPPLDRNKNIVDESDILVATPKGYREERRSGTWATLRYARSSGKDVIIVYPDGSREE